MNLSIPTFSHRCAQSYFTLSMHNVLLVMLTARHHPTRIELATATGLSVKSVLNACHKLEALGLLHHAFGPGQPNRYALLSHNYITWLNSKPTSHP